MLSRASALFAVLASAVLLQAATFADVQIAPADKATSVCPDSPLTLTFAGPVKPTGSGKITITEAESKAVVDTIDTATDTAVQSIGGVPNFKYHPVTFEGKVVTIHPKNGAMTYGKTYRVTVDDGVFTSEAGSEKSADWTFTTKAAGPAPGSAKLVIAADGSGDFATLQGAIDSLPDNNTNATTLFLKKGTYTELICFTNKHNLTITGEDRKQTILQYANNDRFNNSTDSGSKVHIYHRGLFVAYRCNNLTITNLTMHNTTPQGGSQAEAIILNGTPESHAIVANVDLYSYQDTLQINGQAYISNCYIEGDVDFMWGNGPSFFEGCECKGLRSKAYYTQIRNPQTNHGYVYHHCTFGAPENAKDIFLSRIEPTRFPYSEVVLMDCTVSPGAVSAVAWKLDQAKGTTTAPTTEALSNIHFWEFNSHTPDNQPLDTAGRLSVSRQLKQPDDAEIIKNYSDPIFVLGGWDPRTSPAVTTQP